MLQHIYCMLTNNIDTPDTLSLKCSQRTWHAHDTDVVRLLLVNIVKLRWQEAGDIIIQWRTLCAEGIAMFPQMNCFLFSSIELVFQTQIVAIASESFTFWHDNTLPYEIWCPEIIALPFFHFAGAGLDLLVPMPLLEALKNSYKNSL